MTADAAQELSAGGAKLAFRLSHMVWHTSENNQKWRVTAYLRNTAGFHVPCPKALIPTTVKSGIIPNRIHILCSPETHLPPRDRRTSQLSSVLVAASQSPSHIRFAHVSKQLNKVPVSFKIYEIAMTRCSCDGTSSQFLSDASGISTGSNHSPRFLSNLLFYDLISRIAESVRSLIADVCTSVRRNSMNTNAAVSCRRNPANALPGVFLTFWQD